MGFILFGKLQWNKNTVFIAAAFTKEVVYGCCLLVKYGDFCLRFF